METPCQELGYKVGDKFVYNNVSSRLTSFSAGSIIELIEDNNCRFPLFKLVHGYCVFNNAHGKPGAFACIDFIKPIKE